MGNEQRIHIKTRNVSIDIARGIAMVAVVLGHFKGGYFTNLVYSFHMPLFFIISDVLLSNKQPVGQFALKKLKQLMIPYLFTCLLLIVYQAFVYPAGIMKLIFSALYGAGSSKVYIPGGGQIGLIGSIWFLPADALALIFVRFVSDKRWGGICVLVVAAVSYISAQYIWLPLSIQAAGFSSVFVYFGYKCKKIINALWSPSLPEDPAHRRNIRWARIALCVSGLIAQLIGLLSPCYITLAANYSPNFVPSFLFALLISLAIIVLSGDLSSTSLIGRTLAFFGRNSLAVLCMHCLDLKMIPWTELEKLVKAPNETYLMLIEVSIKLALLFVVVHSMSYIPILRNIFHIQPSAKAAE